MADQRPVGWQRRPASERVVVQAPMSFTGSAARIWKLTDRAAGAAKWFLLPLAIVLVLAAWVFVLSWYCVFGLLVVPYRLIRRGGRKRKREELRHRETLAAIERRSAMTRDAGA